MRDKVPREKQSRQLLPSTPKHNRHFEVLRDLILAVVRCRRVPLAYCPNNRLWCARTQRASKKPRLPLQPDSTRRRRMGSVDSQRLRCAQPLLPRHHRYALATDRKAWTYPTPVPKAAAALEATHTAPRGPLDSLHHLSSSSQGTIPPSAGCHQQSRR
jgi:hypothetical protein